MDQTFELLGQDLALSVLVDRLFALDRGVAVRAAALAGRMRFEAEFPASERRIIERWPIELSDEALAARRGLDAAEQWARCPCGAHGRRACEWSELQRTLARAHPVLLLASWSAGVAGESTGRRNPVANAPVDALCSLATVGAVRSRLCDWLRGGDDPAREELWLPSDLLAVRPPPQCPPITWRCQECGARVRDTVELFPDESEDSDCLEHPERRCTSGYSMSMVATCSVCGHDLSWGQDPCEHFAKEVGT